MNRLKITTPDGDSADLHREWNCVCGAVCHRGQCWSCGRDYDTQGDYVREYRWRERPGITRREVRELAIVLGIAAVLVLALIGLGTVCWWMICLSVGEAGNF